MNQQDQGAQDAGQSGQASERRFRRAAVLGAGVMGSGIAAHLAGAGLDVLLLDIVPPDLAQAGAAQQADQAANKKARNKFALGALDKLKASKPSLLFHPRDLERIRTGNLEDDLAEAAQMDLVIEVVREDLAIKQALFARIEQEVAPLEVVVFNIGGNVRFGITDTTERVYRKVWEMAALAGFLVGREAARVMRPRGQGSIFFTGATASLRGGSGFAAFAGAKHALRALSQSMARELGPKGIHVAHVVIDGAIDTAFIAENFPERYALKSADGILDPDAIAESYWQIHRQHRSAWTHEMDLRPWTENF